MKTIAAILLMSLTGTVAADWTQVAADNGIFSAYADRTTIERRGSVATMRGLYEFARGDLNPQGLHYFSTTVEREYDCREKKVRLLAFTDHAGHFGAGLVVGAEQRPRRWEDVVEDSLDHAFWKIACGGTRAAARTHAMKIEDPT